MQFARHYFARNSGERLAIRSRHIFCARFFLHSFTFVYGFQSGYLERLKEQLNEVKTVRVPVALSRLISMPFFHRPSGTPARNSARFISEVCNRAVPGPCSNTHVPLSSQLIPQTRLCLGDILIVASKQLSRPDARILRETPWNMRELDDSLITFLGRGSRILSSPTLIFSSGERFRSFSDASRSNVLLQRATNLLFFPRMDNHSCFFIIRDVNLFRDIKEKLLLFYIF